MLVSQPKVSSLVFVSGTKLGLAFRGFWWDQEAEFAVLMRRVEEWLEI